MIDLKDKTRFPGKTNRTWPTGWLLFIFLAFQTYPFPQKNPGFDLVSKEGKFSHATVTSILQDNQGFIWVGTYSGLCRYDGYECVVFKHNPTNPDSISGNDIICLYLDHRGTPWVGTYKGLDRFNPETESFSHFQKVPLGEGTLRRSFGPSFGALIGAPGIPVIPRLADFLNLLMEKVAASQGLCDNVVNVIVEDQEGFLWIGTNGGLNRLDPAKNQFQVFKHEHGNKNSLSSDVVTSICRDPHDGLWIGTRDGLNLFRPKEGVFTSYKNKKGMPGTLNDPQVSCLFKDRHGHLWIGTRRGGIYRYIHEKDRFIHYPIRMILSDKQGFSANEIKSIYEDSRGMLWVGTFGSGLYRFSKNPVSFELYPSSLNRSFTLSSNMILSIFEDKTGLLWIGTEGGGITTYNHRRETFAHFIHCPLDKNSLSSNTVLSICEDPGHPGEILWIGTYSGLNLFDRKRNHFTHFRHDPGNPSSISSDSINYLFPDGDNGLWVATRNGLNLMDRKTYRFAAFRHDPGNPRSISANGVGPICEANKKQLWVGTNRGLNLLDKKSRTFENFNQAPGKLKILSTSDILCLWQQSMDKEEVLWVGTYNYGLIRYNTVDKKIRHFIPDPQNPNSLSSGNIRSIYIDNNGILWLGTDGGLNRFDPHRGKFVIYSEKQGLCDNRVYGILEADNGYLWLSTFNGLSRFNKNTGESGSFNEGNGVPIRVFNMDAHYKSRSGEMFLGGMNGFISFFPGAIQTNPYVPGVVITDFKLFNESPDTGEKLKKSITDTEELHLSYRDNVFSFEFAALDYSCPENNRYKYKLEGFDKHWIETDAGNRVVQYMNLPHGTYTFRVIGSNNDGVWNRKGVSLKLIITPPFWKEWWFQVTAGLGFILLLVVFYLGRTRRLRKELIAQQRLREILKQSHDEMEVARNLAEFRWAEIEKLITAISSLLVAVDSRGEVSLWNETAEKFFNLPAGRTRGQLFLQVLKDFIDPGTLDKIMQKGLGNDIVYDNFEIPITGKSKDISVKLLLGVVNPILDRGGKKLGFLLLAEDITHRKEEEMRRNLSQKLESLGKMLRSIAHEIKTPLQYIGNNGFFIQDSFENLVKFINTIDQTVLNSENPGFAPAKEIVKKAVEDYDIEYILREGPQASDQIVKGVSRVSTIIQSMLNYTHPSRSIMEQANIHDLLETTLIFIRGKDKEILSIETDFCRDMPQILGYPGELIQVFMNLLINAIDAVRERGIPGIIKITTSIRGQEVVVAVADNGCGIPGDIRDHVYSPFFTTKGVGKGTGQGLALVHNIITERHKGKIYFESQVGVGTTFYVHLPLPVESL